MPRTIRVDGEVYRAVLRHKVEMEKKGKPVPISKALKDLVMREDWGNQLTDETVDSEAPEKETAGGAS